MKRIAVFGKPGSGKSTLSKALAHATGIPLHQLDSIVYQKNGEQIDRQTFDQVHDAILTSDYWIIDGFGPLASFHQRLESADTLVYIDLPYLTSYWLVTKRLLKGLFVKPEGWPEGSSVVKGTWQSYKTLKRCPAFWNHEFMFNLEKLSVDKSLHVIRSVSELKQFIKRHTA
ncbi:P-loop NTPase family protein [Vibrio proteolyticus]